MSYLMGIQAIELRVTFEKHRDVRDPRRVAAMLRQVEEEATKLRHPDPYKGVGVVHYGMEKRTDRVSSSRYRQVVRNGKPTSLDRLLLDLRLTCSSRRERNIPPRMFSAAEKHAALHDAH